MIFPDHRIWEKALFECSKNELVASVFLLCDCNAGMVHGTMSCVSGFKLDDVNGLGQGLRNLKRRLMPSDLADLNKYRCNAFQKYIHWAADYSVDRSPPPAVRFTDHLVSTYVNKNSEKGSGKRSQ